MFLLVNKLVGPTSHDIISQLRRITGIRKIGHAGTLDPAASGLLIVGVGRESTKKLERFLKLDKEYLATVFLGATSDTYDREGIIADTPSGRHAVSLEEMKKVVESFAGEQLQIPPMFSAKKIGGKKLYELARQGKVVERRPVKINLKKIEVKKYIWPRAEILVECTSGTYIRSLAHDIGQKLGCGAYLSNLIRTKIGKYNLEQAVELNKLTPENWREFVFFSPA